MAEERFKPESDSNETHLLRNSKQLLNVLLKDYTTGNNIRWGTDSYTDFGLSFHSDQEITAGLITGWYDGFIRPRADKDKSMQLERQRNKAEVFTPSWIVKLQVDAALEDMKSLPLKEFLQTKWLEITCGEAPYMVNRYDMHTGSVIPLGERAGFMDIKFRRLNQEVEDEKEWIKLALEIYKSSYGYEYQGDSLLLARENLMLTFIDNYFYMFGAFPNDKLILEVSKIVSLNVFQMDGLTYEIPHSNGGESTFGIQLDLFEELENEEENILPQLASLKCWDSGKTIHFKELAVGDVTKMKFDVVIGNPPYQEKAKGTSSKDMPIYHKFLDEAYKIGKHAILITPARFLSNAGGTPKRWNEKMLADEHLKVVYFAQDSSKVFTNTDIKGGVAITYRNINKIFGAIEVFIPFKQLKSILVKVESFGNFQSFSDIVYNRGIYRYSDLIYEKYPKKMTRISDRRLASNAFDKLPELFFDSKPNDGNEYVQIFGRLNNTRQYKWFRKDFLNEPKNFNRYKIILPKANGSGAIGEVLSTPLIGVPLIGVPLIGYTESFIGIGSFDNKIEADACLKYVKSKFARAMLGILKITQDNTKLVWAKVPLQDFTSKSDIDWSQSIAEIDQQLYKKYGLSEEEINFIETNVKEMK